MSFKCDYCRDTAPKNTVCTTVPTLVEEFTTPEGTIGTKIVKEFKQCVNCAPKITETSITVRLRVTPGEQVKFNPPSDYARPGVARFDRE